MPYKATETALERAQREFLRVIESAAAANAPWQLKLVFDESDEDFIRKEVERKLYEPQLPNGGDRERKIIERLKKLSRLKNFADAWRAGFALNSWSKIIPTDPRNAGHYYIRRPLSDKHPDYKWIESRRDEAMKKREWEKKWFFDLLMDGPPESVANFELECLYLLKRPDGETSRLVRLRNDVGESTPVMEMDAEAFHAPQKFRKWCLARGNFNWGAGEKELQKLHNDIGRLAAWRLVNQVVSVGWYPIAENRTPEKVTLDGIWFMGDCARANTKVEEWLQADEDGIYWHRYENKNKEMIEEGYQVAEDGRENPFFQKRPLLHPRTSILDADMNLAPCELLAFPGQAGITKDVPLDRKDAEQKLMTVFFREWCERTRRAVGDDKAFLLVGSFLSYAAAPELFAQHSLFPGIWVHGQANSGKSMMCEWQMEVYGFKLNNGINLRSRNSTAVGLMQAADQYSNLPVWLDEYKSDFVVGDEKMGVIQNAYNRGGQAKFNPSKIQRLMRTNFVISGESTTNEVSMRSRFPHIQMSKHQRIGTELEQKENLQWFTRHRKYFYFFGRYVIENRREFVTAVQKHLESWSREDIDPRLKIVHGVGYASWNAMVELMARKGHPSHMLEEVTGFKKHMVEHSQAAAADVESEMGVNVFLQDLMSACEVGEIAPECFRVTSESLKFPPGHPEQSVMGGDWPSYTLWINPHTTISQLAIYLRKAGRMITLNENDIRDQLSKNEFWVKAKPVAHGKKRSGIKIRFGKPGQKSTMPAWGIKVDLHPLGLQDIGEDEWTAYVARPQDGDPRKGPLFGLIEWVLERQRKQAEDAQ